MLVYLKGSAVCGRPPQPLSTIVGNCGHPGHRQPGQRPGWKAARGHRTLSYEDEYARGAHESRGR